MKNTKESIFTLVFINILVVSVADQMGQHAMHALVPKYANLLGASASLVGLIGSSFALTALAVRPIVGPSVDFLNKKYLLAASSAVKVAAFIIYSQSGTPGLLLAARLIHGVGMGFSAPLLLSMANESLPEGKKASGISFFSLSQVLAMAIGPASGLYLSEIIGYNLTFLAGAVIMAIACFFATRLPNNYDKSLRKSFRVGLNNIIVREALTPATVCFLLAIAYSSISYFMAIYGAERSVADIPLFFSAYALTLFIIRPLNGIIVDRFGAEMTLIPGHIIYAVAFCLISVSKSLPMFILSGVVLAFGYGTVQPTIQHMCLSSVPGERAGAAANTNYTAMDTGILLGGIFAGFVHDRALEVLGDSVTAYAAMYRIMIIPVVVSLTIYLLRRKKRSTFAAKDNAKLP